MATKEQIKRIYALGAANGIVERGNKNDNLHAFIFSMCQKTSVSELTDAEADDAIQHLKAAVLAQSAAISQDQIRLCFRLTYRLAELDTNPTKASVKERLCGVIRKVLSINVDITKDIFSGVTERQGADLIETLKRYVRTAEQRDKRKKGE